MIILIRAGLKGAVGFCAPGGPPATQGLPQNPSYFNSGSTDQCSLKVGSVNLVFLVDVRENPVVIGNAHAQELRLQIKEVPSNGPLGDVSRRVVECIQLIQTHCTHTANQQ